MYFHFLPLYELEQSHHQLQNPLDVGVATQTLAHTCVYVKKHARTSACVCKPKSSAPYS